MYFKWTQQLDSSYPFLHLAIASCSFCCIADIKIFILDPSQSPTSLEYIFQKNKLPTYFLSIKVFNKQNYYNHKNYIIFKEVLQKAQSSTYVMLLKLTSKVFSILLLLKCFLYKISFNWLLERSKCCKSCKILGWISPKSWISLWA